MVMMLPGSALMLVSRLAGRLRSNELSAGVVVGAVVLGCMLIKGVEAASETMKGKGRYVIAAGACAPMIGGYVTLGIVYGTGTKSKSIL
jgi:hypothetical protein